ncbi:hypothetical protein IE53DRAFT_388085 [Violaceomyces palustris]|uniref:Uncharacterized protein n=1 Tax=Violaceomyces palustris TaxID=1673888 RepID=A0ACD0NV07_9BASI|nr:hypothetical protein IE53DRAFT_388085 [Violaceomyces palustris]
MTARTVALAAKVERLDHGPKPIGTIFKDHRDQFIITGPRRHHAYVTHLPIAAFCLYVTLCLTPLLPAAAGQNHLVTSGTF